MTETKETMSLEDFMENNENKNKDEDYNPLSVMMNDDKEEKVKYSDESEDENTKLFREMNQSESKDSTTVDTNAAKPLLPPVPPQMPKFMMEAVSYQYKYPIQAQSSQKSISNIQNNAFSPNYNQNTSHFNKNENKIDYESKKDKFRERSPINRDRDNRNNNNRHIDSYESSRNTNRYSQYDRGNYYKESYPNVPIVSPPSYHQQSYHQPPPPQQQQQQQPQQPYYQYNNLPIVQPPPQYMNIQQQQQQQSIPPPPPPPPQMQHHSQKQPIPPPSSLSHTKNNKEETGDKIIIIDGIKNDGEKLSADEFKNRVSGYIYKLLLHYVDKKKIKSKHDAKLLLPRIVDKVIFKEHGNTIYSSMTKEKIQNLLKQHYFANVTPTPPSNPPKKDKSDKIHDLHNRDNKNQHHHHHQTNNSKVLTNRK